MQRWLTTILLLLVIGVAGCSKTGDSPSAEFMDSKLIVRAGVDDLGNVTVKEFVSVLRRAQKPDGSTAELLGWQKTGSGYSLRVKTVGEFDLNFQWSKPEKLVLLQEMRMDNGESVNGLQFFMLFASMPKVKEATPDKPQVVAGGAPAVAPSEAASAPQTEKPVTDRRNVTASKLQSLECNDYCHLKYLDSAGNSQTALCVDADQCKAWAKEPKSFAAFVGAQAELTVVKKFIPEGNTTVDSVVAVNVAATAVSGASTSASSGGSAKSPLCKSGESTAFACSTGKKDIALCATGNAQSGGVQLAYRIASVGQTAPEMIYPEQPMAARTAFKSGSQSFTGDKSMAYVSFDKGAYRYVIYSAEGKAFDKAGVAVEQGGKRIANLACSAAAVGDWSVVSGAGLPTDSRAFDLP
jgi:hypothetical protein